jgi:hypothetical protein
MEIQDLLSVLTRLRRNRGESDPAPNRRAIVECDGYQCVGIQLPDGSWIDLQGTLLNVVSVIVQL